MTLLNELEDLILSRERLHDDGVPSVSIATTDQSGELAAHVITSGREDVDTIYQACSISKAITALAVAKLVDLKIISYDDRVVSHIPYERLQRINKIESHIADVTVGSLVSHTSGLSQHGFPGYTDFEAASVDDIFNGRPPANTPRIRFSSLPFAQLSYSGGGYLLLQIFLEYLLDKPFPEVMYDIVLEPLDMLRSSYGDLTSTEYNYAKAYSTADQAGSMSEYGYNFFPEKAAAGLWTTPTDLLKAVRAIQHSLMHDNGYLSTETARQMLTKVSPNNDVYSMAMGWGSDDQFFAHRGDNEPGYNTYVFGTHFKSVNNTEASNTSRQAAQGAIAILTNSVVGFPTIQKIVSAIFWLNRWPLVDSLPGNFGSMIDFVPYAAPKGTAINSSWKDWVGTWSGSWTIMDNQGTPALRFSNELLPVVLLPAAAPSIAEGEHSYQVLVVEGFEMALRLSRNGGKQQLHVIQSEGVTFLGMKEPR